MAVTYKRLFHLLIDKGMTNAINCGVDDILEFVPDEKEQRSNE